MNLVRPNLNELHLPGKNLDDIVIKPDDDLDELLRSAIEDHNSLPLVKKVVAAGANLNSPGDGQLMETPLEAALINGNNDIAIFLIQSGATLDMESIRLLMTINYPEFMRWYEDEGYDVRELNN